MKPFQALTAKLHSLSALWPLQRPFLIARTLFQDIVRCDLTRHASAMAYVSLLSMVPSLVAIFCILSFFTPLLDKGNNLVEQLRQQALRHLASGSGDAVVVYLDQMLAGLDVSKIGLTSFASVLVTLVLLLRQIEGALNRIWLISIERNPFRRFMYFWTFLTLGVVLLGVFVGITSADKLSRLASLQHQIVQDDGTLGWFAGFTGGFVFFFFLYKIVPNCEVRSKSAAAGATVASFALAQASRLYGIYVIDSKSYQTLYGALAQLPLFLMWLYICWIIILLGALISWRLQEGFPNASEDESLDSPQNPIEHLRNTQVKATLPMLSLLTVHKHFQLGSGQGICAQDLAAQLKLPKAWVIETLEGLTALGYVVAARRLGDANEKPSALAPYFPTKPAESLTLERINADLAQPLEAWMNQWNPEISTNLPNAFPISMRRGQAVDQRDGKTIADALRMLPKLAKKVAGDS